MAYAKTVGKLDLYNLAKRNGVAMRTIAKYLPISNPTTGLVGWWKFDEASGTTAADSGGNAITGTLVNTPAWVAGKINNALNFDKAAYRHVTLASNAALAMASGSFTFAAWINPTAFDANAWHGIIGCSVAQGASYGISDSGGTSRRIKLTRVNSVDFATGTQAISTGAWQHVAVVMNRAGTSLTYYLNGVADIVAYSAEVFDAGIQSNRIGCRLGAGGEPFDGKIDDVRIYNRALSASEIATLYNVTNTYDVLNINSGLVGWWKLDEADGTMTAADSSGYGNTGTLLAGMTGNEWEVASGKIKGALSFDGSSATDKHVSVGNHAEFNSLTTATLAGWVYWDAAALDGNYHGIFGKTGGSNSSDFSIKMYNDGKLQYWAQKSGGFSKLTTSTIQVQQWIHLALTYDGSTIRFYKNGVEVDSVVDSGLSTGSTYDMKIGKDWDNNWLGMIDDVRFYNRTLSADDVAALYAVTAPA